jgi:hypothetical protein
MRAVKPILEPVWYAPDIDGNRSDPDPFRVRLQPLTAAAALELQREHSAGVSQKTTGQDLIARAEILQRRVFERCVLEVKGYSLAAPTGTITPRTGAELFDTIQRAGAGEAEIIEDVYLAARGGAHLESGLVTA